MTRVLHLIDDPNLGGVNRAIADQSVRLTEATEHRVEVVRIDRPAPAINADIVVVHFAMAWRKLPFLATLRARLGGARMVIVEHGYSREFERLHVSNRRRFRLMLRLGYGMADRVVAVSRGQAAWLSETGAVAASRLTAIPQALETTSFEALPLPDRRNGPLRLGAYGRYAGQKGFDLLIEAMRHVDPSVATLRLAGYGPDLPALLQAASGLPHVSVADSAVVPADFLHDVDAVAIPSRFEPFGLVALEAKAAGRPVIACAVDGLTEQLRPEFGIACAPGSPSELARAIERLAGCDVTAMGAAARADARGAFEHNIVTWRQFYASLASDRQGAIGHLAGQVA